MGWLSQTIVYINCKDANFPLTSFSKEFEQILALILYIIFLYILVLFNSNLEMSEKMKNDCEI